MAEKDDKRQLILQAAMEIFSVKDYHETTVEEIAKKAGVGKGTIYQYFPNKQRILTEVHSCGKFAYLRKLHDLMESHQTTAEVLREIIEFHIDNIGNLTVFARGIFFREEFADDIKYMSADVAAALTPLWQRGRERGEIKDISEDVFASYFIGVMMSVLAYMLMHDEDVLPREKIKREFGELALNGLLAEGVHSV